MSINLFSTFVIFIEIFCNFYYKNYRRPPKHEQFYTINAILINNLEVNMFNKYLIFLLLITACVSKPNNSEITESIKQNIESRLPKGINSSSSSKEIIVSSIKILKVGKKKTLSIPDAGYKDTWWPVRVLVKGSFQPYEWELGPVDPKSKTGKIIETNIGKRITFDKILEFELRYNDFQECIIKPM